MSSWCMFGIVTWLKPWSKSPSAPCAHCVEERAVSCKIAYFVRECDGEHEELSWLSPDPVSTWTTMSFEYAPVTKGLMMATGLTSLIAGIFDIKHYLHLQFVPHISRHHQYWRLITHHLAFANSSDLFVAQLVLYNVGVQVERMFGSVKFASFAVVSTLTSTAIELSLLLLLHRFGFNYIPAGPSTLVFSILYQYSRIVPHAYDFRVFGIPLTNKIFIYVLAAQLALGNIPGSTASTLIGILVGQLYRSDLAGLNTYRLPPSLVHFSSRFIRPLIGSTRPQPRSNHARPDRMDDPRGGTPDSQTDDNTSALQQQSPSSSSSTSTTPADETRSTRRTAGPHPTSSSSVMREWVDELTGRADRASAAPHVPTESEISTLVSMFPNLDRQVIVAALQQSSTLEGAVETLLVS